MGTLCLQGLSTAEPLNVQLPLGRLRSDSPDQALHTQPSSSKPQLLLPDPTHRPSQELQGTLAPPSVTGCPGLYLYLLAIAPPQPTAAPQGECSCLWGSARPPFGASCPVSPPLTHPPRGSQSAPSKAHRRPCRPWDPSDLSPFPGLALALQHHIGCSLSEPSPRSSSASELPHAPAPLHAPFSVPGVPSPISSR